MNSLFLSPILVGRTSQLQSLEQLLDQSSRGNGITGLITGEAGIGKSRLVNELKARASARGFLTLQGNCFELDRAISYAPLTDLLRTFVSIQPPERLSERLGPSAQELVKLLPELSKLLPVFVPSPPLAPELEKRRLFETLRQFVLRLSTEQPLLVVIEDLHWSDDSTLEFLQFLSRGLIGTHILLLPTFRSEETNPSLIHFLAELDRERRTNQVALTPLQRRDVQMMLRAIFQMDHLVRADFVDGVCAVTEGNPFFIEEVCKSLVHAGELDYAESRWDHISVSQLNIPLTVQDAVARRVHGLSAPAKHLLTLASVAGRHFDFMLLQELTQMNEEQLLPLVKELVAAQLVVEESTDQFSFRHALTREAAYAGLLLRERKKYHRLIGETIERMYAHALDAHVADLAYHFYQAEAWETALFYSQHAGERAQLLYAPREALENFSHAIDAGRRLESALPSGLFRARGQTLEMLGDFERARADYEQALNLARDTRDRRAEWQALVDLGFLWASRDYNQTGQFFQRALELARSIGEPDLVARSLNRIGNWNVNIDRPGEGLRHHQEALDAFQKLDDRSGLAETLDLMGMASYLSGDLIQGVAHYKRAVPLFEGLAHRQGLASSLALLSQRAGALNFETLVATGDTFREAAQEGERALKIAREIGYRAGEAFALIMLSMCLGAEGDYGRALSDAQVGLEIAEEISHRQWQGAAHCTLGAIELELFAFDNSRPHLERALELARETRTAYWIANSSRFLARCHVSKGDTRSAESIIGAAVKVNEQPRTAAQRLLWVAQVEASLALGDAQRALDLLDKLIAFAPGLSNEKVIPYLWNLRGEALLALGKTQDAIAVLIQARDAASRRGERPLLWRVHTLLGKAELANNPKQARVEFEFASRIVEELAETIQGRGFREIFLRGAAKLIPGFKPIPQSSLRMSTDLTPREREVAALIAQGKSNREIARVLVVSERTVESHVSNILSKLRFASRAQIAVWANEKPPQPTNPHP